MLLTLLDELLIDIFTLHALLIVIPQYKEFIIASWLDICFVSLHEVLLKQQLAPLIISADTFSNLGWFHLILN